MRFAQREERELQHIEYNLLQQVAALEEHAEIALDELREAKRDATRGSTSRGYSHGHGDPNEAETQKVRQADKVGVPPFPQITKLVAWKTNLQRHLILASGSPDFQKFSKWVSETWDGTKTYEELDDPGENDLPCWI